jgi:hypothetical protein
MTEITLADGRKPANEFGTCFDAAAISLLANPGHPSAIICHGVCVSNLPGQEGEHMAHAWIELIHEKYGHVAIDPIWLVAMPQEKYRKDTKCEYVVTYTRAEFMRLWRETDYPGPWDERVAVYTKEMKLPGENKLPKF